MTVHGGSTLRLHELSARQQSDGSWVIGRVATGEFVSVPDVARRALALLGDGVTVGAAQQRLLAETGEAVDLLDFATALVELDFVRAVDGTELAGSEPPVPTLPSLTPRQVRWTVHPVTVTVLAALPVLGLAAVLLRPEVLPGYRALLWSDSAAAVILGNAVLGWLLALLHELAHLVTARAVDVPARMSLGTRLQFLVVQTDVSGVRARHRAARLTVYLAGIAVNLAVASLGLVALACGLRSELLSATVLLSLLLVLPQFLVFLRSDLYFVLQDLTGCANLHTDGTAYARHLGLRLLRRQHPDPSARLTARERRAVRWYAALLVLGSTAMLSLFALVTLPATVVLLARAAGEVLSASSPAAVLDGAAALVVAGSAQALWARTWWRRHGARARALVAGRRPSTPGATGSGPSDPSTPEGGD